jgi:hypothetical protein
MPRPSRPPRRALALLSVGAALTLSGTASLAPTGATASSHREAPRISGLPQLDNTDVYAFVSPDRPDSVTFVANWQPFSEPAGGPNFYPWATDAVYDINIDNDGDARPDLTYRWSFANSYRSKNTFLYNTGPVTSLDDPDLNFRETYKLEVLNRDTGRTRVLTGKGKVAPSNVGTASMPDYQALRDQATVSLPGGIKSFAGQADDAFFLDLRVFDLLYGGDLSEVGNDTVAGYNVNTIALQVPIDQVTAKGDPVVGVYSSTSRFAADHNWVQVSRLGMPLVNEVVVPIKDKDRFNASKPSGDAQFLRYVTHPEVPRLIEGIYKIKAPATPRKDLVQAFLTGVPGLNQPRNVKPSEQLRLNTSIKPSAEPKRLGVLEGDKAGFPNGRRLTDDVLDITLQVAEGELVGSPNDLGDAVNANDVAFGDTFPYVALPASGSATRPGPAASGSPARPGGAGGSQSTAPARAGGTLLDGGNTEPAGSSDRWQPVNVVLPVGLVALGIASLVGGVYVLWRRYTVRA